MNFNGLFILPIVALGAVYYFLGLPAVLSLLTVALVLYFTRYLTRIGLWKMRRRLYGNDETSWYRIIPQRQRTGPKNDLDTELVDQMKRFIDGTIENVRRPYLNRDSIEIVWVKDKDRKGNPSVRLYIGVPTSKIDSKSNKPPLLVNLAKTMGAKIERVAAPKIPKGSSAFGKRTGIRTSNLVDKGRETIVPISAQLLETEGFNGAIVINMEHQRESEGARFNSLANSTLLRDKSDRGMLNSPESERISYFTDMSSRATIGVIAKRKHDRRIAETVLNSTMSSISGFAINGASHNPGAENNRRTAIYALFLGAAASVATFFGLVPFNFYIGIMSVTGIVFLLSAVNAPFVGTKPLEDLLQRGFIPVPNFTWWSPRWYYYGLVNYHRKAGGRDGTTGSAFAWPSTNMVFSMHPHPITSFAAFHKLHDDTDLEFNPLPDVGLPKSMVNDSTKDDLFLGLSGKNQKVFYPIDRINFQTFVSGSPGSGKSNLMLNMFLQLAFQSARKAGGREIGLLWGETKTQGAYEAWELVENFKTSLFLDVANPESKFRLSLEGPRLGAKTRQGKRVSAYDVDKNTDKLISYMKYAWQDAMMAESTAAINSSIKAAMFLTKSELDSIELNKILDTSNPNIAHLAFVLLNGDPRFKIGASIEQMLSWMPEKPEPKSREYYLARALVGLSRYYQGGKADMNKLGPPQNKMQQLMRADHLWAPHPNKKDVHISDIVNHRGAIVLNTGAHVKEDGTMEQSLSAEASQDILTFISYGTWMEIKNTGANWKQRNKYFVEFYDEISQIVTAGASAKDENVISQIANEGRGFNTGINGATQNLARIVEDVAGQLMRFETKFFFRTNDVKERELIIKDVGRETQYTESNLASLPDGVAIGRIFDGTKSSGYFTLYPPLALTMKNYLRATEDVMEAAHKYREDKMRQKTVEDGFLF